MEPRLLPKKNKPVMRPVILKRDSPSTSRVGKTEDKARPNPADPIHIARLLDGKMIIKVKKMIARKKFPNSIWAAFIFLVNGTASKRPRVKVPQKIELIKEAAVSVVISASET